MEMPRGTCHFQLRGAHINSKASNSAAALGWLAGASSSSSSWQLPCQAATRLLRPQTLKIIRYASRLVVAVSAPGGDVQARFSSLEKSVGTSRCVQGPRQPGCCCCSRTRLAPSEGGPAALRSLKRSLVEKPASAPTPPLPCRKAYRLGKFLQHVNSLRRTQLSNRASLLEVIATAGDGLYYFLDQYNWCDATCTTRTAASPLAALAALCLRPCAPVHADSLRGSLPLQAHKGRLRRQGA
jgi:hypothetical protein